MFPPKGYPTWRDAMADGYLMSKEDIGDLADSIMNIESMVTEMYHHTQDPQKGKI